MSSFPTDQTPPQCADIPDCVGDRELSPGLTYYHWLVGHIASGLATKQNLEPHELASTATSIAEAICKTIDVKETVDAVVPGVLEQVAEELKEEAIDLMSQLVAEWGCLSKLDMQRLEFKELIKLLYDTAHGE